MSNTPSPHDLCFWGLGMEAAVRRLYKSLFPDRVRRRVLFLSSVHLLILFAL